MSGATCDACGLKVEAVWQYACVDARLCGDCARGLDVALDLDALLRRTAEAKAIEQAAIVLGDPERAGEAAACHGALQQQIRQRAREWLATRREETHRPAGELERFREVRLSRAAAARLLTEGRSVHVAAGVPPGAAVEAVGTCPSTGDIRIWVSHPAFDAMPLDPEGHPRVLPVVIEQGG